MKQFITTAIAILVFAVSFGQHSENKEHLNLFEGIAVKGYDPVAYFAQHEAIKGKPEFSYTWHGAIWQFSSQKNLDAFKEQPEKFAPQYGGYCAFGASRGYMANTDPVAFTIVGDKLYLNYNLKVKEEWLKDTAQRIKLANQYWDTLH